MCQGYSYLSKVLKEWYSLNKRDLPWRDTKDAYCIWVSEIILQQTRVAQGYDYYVKFIDRFPNVKVLAGANEEEVLKLWQGLGYYSRARNLHQAAKSIASSNDGEFPSSYDKILDLKGVGEYTAAAIGSFAFDLPHAVVDGNVYRVLSRLFAIDTPIDSTAGKKIFKNLAEELLDREDPGLHNQAIMEFGALQCIPISPNCMSCPLSDVCLAFANNEVGKYPLKQGKTQVKERFFNYFDIRFEESIYLKKRIGNDIWKNLYELPLIETECKTDLEDLQQIDQFKILFKDVDQIEFYSTPVSIKHVLSHRLIFATFYRVRIKDDRVLKQFEKVNIEDVDRFPISRLVDKYFQTIADSDLFS